MVSGEQEAWELGLEGRQGKGQGEKSGGRYRREEKGNGPGGGGGGGGEGVISDVINGIVDY